VDAGDAPAADPGMPVKASVATSRATSLRERFGKVRLQPRRRQRPSSAK
jgi:hypothetical protein